MRTISKLAVTMVFITMTAIAVITHYFIPNTPWPVAFVIGAILAPLIAIAASAILKGLGLPLLIKKLKIEPDLDKLEV